MLIVTLPLSSPSHQVLEAQLRRAVRDAGLEPLSAADQNITLSPEQMQELSRLESEAEQLELALELEEAAARRRQIVEFLEGAGATASNPARLADALARLAATRMEAEQRTDAVRLWRRALALRADLELDGTFSPSAREAFQEAQQQGGTLPQRPGSDALSRLCDDHDLDAVLWVAAGVDDGDLTLMRVLHRPGGSDQAEVRHNLGTMEVGAAVALPAGPQAELEEALAALAPDPTDGPSVVGPQRPWYRRWWFYVTIGAVVAGAATATGLAIGLGERQVDVVVHMP